MTFTKTSTELQTFYAAVFVQRCHVTKPLPLDIVNQTVTFFNVFLRVFFLLPIFHVQTEIQFINRELQTSGQKVVTKADELIHYSKTQKNIEVATDTLTLCLPGMLMTTLIQEHITI